MIKIKFTKNKLALAIIVLLVTFLFLVGLSVKRQNGNFLKSGVFTSVQGVIYKNTNDVKDWFSFVVHFSQIKQENQDLESQNASMKKKETDYDALNDKFTRLSGLLKLEGQRNEYNYINCSIIGNGSGDLENSFYIDKGTNDGIKIGLAVITEQGLVGKVIEVTNGYSIVGTLNNENIEVGAMDQSSNNNSGLATGYEDNKHNKLAILSGLPQNSDVKKGDQIITYGQLYPKDIPIGQVISVGKDATTISTNAIIKPYVDFNKVEEVSVVIPKNSDLSEIKY